MHTAQSPADKRRVLFFCCAENGGEYEASGRRPEEPRQLFAARKFPRGLVSTTIVRVRRYRTVNQNEISSFQSQGTRVECGNSRGGQYEVANLA